MRAIYKRELRSCFHSMIGYVFIAFLVAYTGIYFLAYRIMGIRIFLMCCLESCSYIW